MLRHFHSISSFQTNYRISTLDIVPDTEYDKYHTNQDAVRDTRYLHAANVLCHPSLKNDSDFVTFCVKTQAPRSELASFSLGSACMQVLIPHFPLLLLFYVSEVRERSSQFHPGSFLTF